MNDGNSLRYAKSQFYANSGQTRPAGYEQYLAQGPTHEIEMSRLGRSGDQLPLLADPGLVNGSYDPYANHAAMSDTTLVPVQNQFTSPNPAYADPAMNRAQMRTPSPNGGYGNQSAYPQGMPTRPQYPQQVQQGIYGDREATLHRPSPPSRNQSQFGENSSMNGSTTNLAGRGAHRAPY